MENKVIQFMSDKVKVKTGKVDNGAEIVFEVGEYQLDNIKELAIVVDKILEVQVTIKEL